MSLIELSTQLFMLPNQDTIRSQKITQDDKNLLALKENSMYYRGLIDDKEEKNIVDLEDNVIKIDMSDEIDLTIPQKNIVFYDPLKDEIVIEYERITVYTKIKKIFTKSVECFRGGLNRKKKRNFGNKLKKYAIKERKNYDKINEHAKNLTCDLGDDKYLTRYNEHDYPEIYELSLKMIGVFWTPEEIDLGTDERHWGEKFIQLNKDGTKTCLNENERTFLKNIFAFFTFGDGIVIENGIKNFMDEIQHPDIKHTYIIQMFFEVIHARTYAMILDRLVTDQKERKRLEDLFKTDEQFIELKEWIESYMDKSKPLSHRLLAFACFEGIIFSGAFCAIFWLKKRGLMPGLTFSNELISRDEGMHTDYAVMLLELCNVPISLCDAYEIIEGSVDVGSKFITRIADCNLLGINHVSMIEYINFVANRLFKCISYFKDSPVPFVGATNPFEWMELISLQGKTNFFERRVSEYSRAAEASLMNKNVIIMKEEGKEIIIEDWDDNVFTTNAVF